MKMMGDDPPYLSVGTEVSAKYKGAFCEAKIRKVVKSVKCKILFKQGLGIASVPDEHVKGMIRVGSVVEARHPDKKEFIEATITKIQDCSQYTVVFDDGDITTLRRSALCLKSGRHFAESETLDQLPLTHPEHFSNPVIGGRRGRRHRTGIGDSSDDEEINIRSKCFKEEKEADIGRVVCVEGEKKKQKDNWFPGLVVAPTAQDTVRIHVREEYLVRSFKDGRYYTVPKKETAEFTREVGAKVDNHTLKAAVEKALLFLDKDELPPHWDRDLLFGINSSSTLESDHNMDSDSSDDEPREEKDHFVAQLYKFMDDRGTPINQGPTVCSKDVDLYRLFKVVHNHGGYNRVTNYNHWKTVSNKLGFGESPVNINLVKHVYKRFLHSFEEFYRKLGCTMVNHPRTYRNRNRSGRSLIRDRDRLSTSSTKLESKTRSSDTEEAENTSLFDSPYTINTEVDIKIENEDESLSDAISPSPKQLPNDSVDKNVAKKLTDSTPVKVKEEKKEEISPSVLKDATKRDKSRIRQTKLKNISLESNKKGEFKELAEEKKKRTFPRTLGKREKESQIIKQPTGLAITRQKRGVKDKVKSLIKFKISKDPQVLEAVESSEKTLTNFKPKIKEETIPPVPLNKSKKEEPVTPLSNIEEKKKGGRKKKEKKDYDENFDTLPTYKSVCVGDKLKVYYGPTHESKVTYEAKVLSIRTEGSETMYLVHYTGWNNRYDEYIKHSRIADNLSWVPGRAAKKPATSLFKSGRRKNISGKVESNPPKIGSPSLNKKSPAVTRSSSRMSVAKRDEAQSDNEIEEDNDSSMPSLYMSDEFLNEKDRNDKVKEILGINDFPGKEENDNSECDNSKLETSTEKRRTKRKNVEDNSQLKSSEIRCDLKVSDSSGDSTSIKNKLDKRTDKKMFSDSESPLPEKRIRVITRRRSSTTDDKNDLNNVVPDGSVSTEDKKKIKKRSPDSSDSVASGSKKKSVDKRNDFSDESSEPVVPSLSVKDESPHTKSSLADSDDALKGRDFDLNQIRSELKGLERTVKLSETDTFIEKNSLSYSAQEESDDVSEDVYEFKEPEPFEFEVRKSSEEKNKSQRRSLGRIYEEMGSILGKKPQSSNLLLPNIFYKGKKEVQQNEHKKEALESVYDFETGEEMFDKICSSPLRAATDESNNKNFQLFTDLPEEEQEDESESTRNSGGFTYSVTDNEYFDNTEVINADVSNSPQDTRGSPQNAESGNENSNYDSNEVESTSKSCFSRDDDEDDLGDESINYAIQRAIKQDISDDSNQESLNCPSSPNLIQIDTTMFHEKQIDKCNKPVVELVLTNLSPQQQENTHDFVGKIEKGLSGLEHDKIELVQENHPTGSSQSMLDSPENTEPEELGINTSNNIYSGKISFVKHLKEEDIPASGSDVYSYSIQEQVACSDEKSVSETGNENSSLILTKSENEVRIGNKTIPEIPELLTVAPPDDFSENINLLEGHPESKKEEVIEDKEEIFVKNEETPIINDGNSLHEITESTDQDVIEKHRKNKNDKDENSKSDVNLVSLLCEETIPGSPSSHAECAEQTDEEKLEIPVNIDQVDKRSNNLENEDHPGNEEATGATEESSIISPESPLSSHSDSSRIEISGSPPNVDNDSSKSQFQREYEVDLDVFAGPKESDDESRLEDSIKSESSKKNNRRGKHTRKRSSEKKKINRSHHGGSDSDDDTSENSIKNCPISGGNNTNLNLININSNISVLNDSTKSEIHSSNSRSPKPCKFNFLLNFESDMDANQRISALQSSIQQIRKLYSDLKSELAIIDRRRKKLKKREREGVSSRIH